MPPHSGGFIETALPGCIETALPGENGGKTMRKLISVLVLVGATSAVTALGDGLPAEYQQLEYIQPNPTFQEKTGNSGNA